MRGALTILAAAGLVALLAPRGPAQVRADDRSARVDSLFARWSAPGEPGCAVIVVQLGEVIHRGLHGSAVVEHGIPIDGSTVFDLASLSKHFTAAAAALLVEDGRLTWDDPLRRWIPELPAIYAPVRVRHLVHHTSGIRGYFALWALAGRDIESAVEDEQVLAMLARQARLDFPPGERETYSNSNYFLLAKIVERATGGSVDDLLRERLFAPLAMASTRFVDDHEDVIPGLAASYFERADGTLARRVLKHDVVGPSGLHSTIDDIGRWAIALLSDEPPGSEMLRALSETGTLAGGAAIAYARGLRVVGLRGLPTVSHGGTMGGFRTYMVLVPEERWGTVVLCNQLEASPFQLTRSITEIWFEDRMAPAGERNDAVGPGSGPPPAADPAPLDLVGRYWSDELAAFHEIVRTESGLAVRAADLAPKPLTVVGPDRLSVEGVRLTVQRDAGGRVAGYALDTGRAAGVVLRPVAAPREPASDSFEWPAGIAVNAAGDILVAERRADRVRRIDGRTGEVSTVAGNGSRAFRGDGGPASRASLSIPELIALDSEGDLYIADRGNARVRRVDARTGIITTVAGNGTVGYDGDGGPATAAALSHPFGVFVDSAGNLFIADTENHVIRRVDAVTGTIETVAGSGEAGFSGDGGPAVRARLQRPHNVTLDPGGNLVIGDSGNQRIRRVDRETGRIETLYGTGEEGAGADGIPARESPFAYFGSILYDRAGDLWIAGWVDGRIRRVDAETGIITTVARVRSPYGMAFDGAGSLVVAEAEPGRVVRVDVETGSVTPVTRVEGPGLDPTGGSPLEVPRGTTPRLDGVVEGSEWEGAARVALDRGGEALFLHDGDRLHAAIRGPGDGWSHVYLAEPDSMRVLHASAALGSARYRRTGAGPWSLTSGFTYELRDRSLSPEAEAARAAYFDAHGWVGSVVGMGDPGAQEIAIDLDRVTPATRIAVLRATDPAAPSGWPELEDDTRSPELVRGDSPPSLSLAPANWAGIVLAGPD